MQFSEIPVQAARDCLLKDCLLRIPVGRDLYVTTPWAGGGGNQGGVGYESLPIGV